MRDKYNLNTLPPGVMPEDAELIDDHAPSIPGMGPEDKVDPEADVQGISSSLIAGQIPGLDMEPVCQEPKPSKKVPYAKPIPRNFQAQWNESHSTKKPAILPTPSHISTATGAFCASDDEDGHVLGVDPVAFGMEQLGRATLTLFGLPATDSDKTEISTETMQSLPLAHLPTPTALIVDGTILPIQSESDLERAVRAGEEQLTQVSTLLYYDCTAREVFHRIVKLLNPLYSQSFERFGRILHISLISFFYCHWNQIIHLSYPS